MKRLTSDSDSTDSKSRKVSLATYHKWKIEMDKECKTMEWLECETSGTGTKNTVEKLKCTACSKYETSIQGRRNFSSK